MTKSFFVSPRDGDMLSDAAGVRCDAGLIIPVSIAADADVSVSVNGTAAVWNGTCWQAEVMLREFCNVVRAAVGEYTETVRIYWLRHAAEKFSLSSDDNIWCLADLTKNENAYASAFDHPYLAVYRRAHELYGVKVRLNLFYELDNPCGLAMFGPFDLSMMTDRYREEFRANAHWLRFAFHARSEFPDDPYVCADAAQMERDYRAVTEQIVRFAGAEALESVTTNHWGSGTPEAVSVQQSLGLRALMGYMDLNAEGNPWVSYYLTSEQVLHAKTCDFWLDHTTGMAFGRIEAVLNSQDAPTTRCILDRMRREYPHRGFVEIMIHEQYFYPSYGAHLPDFETRVLDACAWCRENGYEPAFTGEAIAP